ncbi:MAG: class I poly(R)-hydroxyalkanoic acid synthase [Sphingobium sp.]
MTPSLEQFQHWTRIMGLAQQTIMERAASLTSGQASSSDAMSGIATKIAEIQAESAQKGMSLWQNMMAGVTGEDPSIAVPVPATDRRFRHSAWSEHPVYSLLHQTYLLFSDALLRMVDSFDGLDAHQKEKARFAVRSLIDAASPSNFPLTNPQVIERTLETKGQNLLLGLERMMADLERGQLSQTDAKAFTVGGNVAATPGKVVHETRLYQLIQYSPMTDTVLATPLVIFPPWINRFYILDLSAEKSFVRWAVEQGLTVFMVSWKSADATIADVSWDDYVGAQVDAIDTIRDLLDVKSVHAIGYCVAGTTLAATLAWLDVHGRQDIVKSATFLTAQVDFADSGDLGLFVDTQQIQVIDRLVKDGVLDGRYLAATFNLLRSNDLIWSYVVNNYLLADDYLPFDLLFWNGDTANLPGKWLRSYLEDMYRDNKLVQTDCLSVAGTPIDLRRITVPAYIQAGVEDHIAPARSVWKLMHHLSGPRRFLLAGSGHIAGVVNPPAKRKYRFWSTTESAGSLDEFRAIAAETPGSWWPDWFAWTEALDTSRIAATGARQPGGGNRPAIEDAPGRYVMTR